MTLRCSSRRKETPIFGRDGHERKQSTEAAGMCGSQTDGRFSLASGAGQTGGEEAPTAYLPKIAVSLRRLLQIP